MDRGTRRYLSNRAAKRRICEVKDLWGRFWEKDFFEDYAQWLIHRAKNHHPYMGQGRGDHWRAFEKTKDRQVAKKDIQKILTSEV